MWGTGCLEGRSVPNQRREVSGGWVLVHGLFECKAFSRLAGSLLLTPLQHVRASGSSWQPPCSKCKWWSMCASQFAVGLPQTCCTPA